MKPQKGYALIEVLIVVVIIGIIAAIPVAGLLRSLISANEAATIGDIRTVISSQAAYQSANGGWYESNFACLTLKGGCIPSTPTNSPTFLDSDLASLLPRSGYGRQVPSLGSAPVPTNPRVSAGSVSGYTYTATPSQPGQTGVRGFGGDATGLVCYSSTGAPTTNAGRLSPGPQCRVLK